MNGDEEQLAIKVVAKLTELEKQMAKANGITAKAYREMSLNSRKATRQMELDAARSAKRINQAFATVGQRIGDFGKAFAVGFVSTAALRSAQELIDTATRIENSLKVAGLSGAELKEVYDRLFVSAQKNAAPIESLASLYSRLSLTQKELGVSQAELLSFTDNISLALRVGGTSAQEASGALLQLSQALSGGVVRAEEFNSVIEGTPTIAKAVAAGLREAGGSVATLRSLVVDGKVSSEAFFRAFEVGAATLQEKVAGSEMTVSQQFIRLQNVMVDTAGKIDDATGASGRLGGALDDLAGTVQSFGTVIVSVAESDLGIFIGKIADAYGQVNALVKLMGGLPGVFSKMSQMQVDIMNGKPLGTTMSEGNIQNRIDQAFEGTGAAPKTGRLPAAPAAPDKVEPISLEEYPVQGGSRPGGRAKGRSAGAAAADRARESVKELITELEEELRLVGATDAERRKSEASRRAGASATDAEREKIIQLNEAIYQEEEARRKASEEMDYYRGVTQGAIDDIRSAMDDGKITWEEWGDIAMNVLNRIIDRIEDDLLNALFDAGQASQGIGGGGGGLLGSLLGGISKIFSYDGGGDTPRGPRVGGLDGRGGFLAMVHPNETITDHTRPSVRMPAPSSGAVGVAVTSDVRVTVDHDKFVAYVEKTSQQQVSKAAPGIVKAATQRVVPTVTKHQDITASDYRRR